MRRTAQELSAELRDVIVSQSEDALATLLENISDSVSDVDMGAYVSRSEYDTAIAERTALEEKLAEAQESVNRYRESYINRFYQPQPTPGTENYIMGAAPQEAIEKDEYDVDYSELYE